MKLNYLFPNRLKKIGWLIFIPSAIIGLITLFCGYEPSFFNFNVPAIIFEDGIFYDGTKNFGMIKNNILNEILGILIIISSLFIAFSEEKTEDEYITKIRLESLVWAVYFNYAILLLSFLFVYDLSFIWVMIFNMFTILIFFIVRFNCQISKLKKSNFYEE